MTYGLRATLTQLEPDRRLAAGVRAYFDGMFEGQGEGLPPNCALYSPQVQDEDGVCEGYRDHFWQRTPEFPAAAGLPWDARSADPHRVYIPDDADILPWIVDNGSYPGLVPGTFIMPASFDPHRPLSNPAMFFGAPSSRLAQMLSREAEGLKLAVKTIASALGTAASIGAALNVVAGMGLGAISSVAAGLASSLGIATPAALQLATSAGVVSTANASSILAGAANVGLSSALAGTLTTTLGVGAVSLGVSAAIFGSLFALAAAFPAESPSMHVVAAHPDSPIRIWYLNGGQLVGEAFVNAKNAAPPGTRDGSQWDPSAYPIAQIGDVDAETFFAGLVYLGAQFTWPPLQVELRWQSRVTGEGIAAFRAARAHGASISESIRAAASFPRATPVEMRLQRMSLTPIPPTGSAKVLECFARAHEKNEALVRAATTDPIVLHASGCALELSSAPSSSLWSHLQRSRK